MAKRFGCEVPRIWTSPLRELTPETSKGFECIEFAEDVLEIELFPWQKWLLIHALELNPDGSYRFDTVLVLVARQNGKTLVMVLLSLWRMFMDDAKLVIGTAQNLDVAEEAWQSAVDMAQAVDELAAEIPARGGVVQVNGKKTLKLRTGERYKVAAASRRGGRGLSGDLVLLDELREHQSWDAWAAVTNTTMARSRSQIFAFSNAGDAASIVLRALRKMALWQDGVNGGAEDRLLAEWAEGTNAGELLAMMADLDEDESDDLADDLASQDMAIFEWSAIPGRSKWDRDQWAQANPSLGYTITERKIASKLRDPDHVCRPENLCEWSSTSAESVFGPQKWEECADPASTVPADQLLKLCIDTSSDRGMSHIAIAGRREDGLAHAEIVATRAGTEWVAQWLRHRLDAEERTHHPDGTPIAKLSLSAVTLQANGAPVSSLLDTIRALCEEFSVPFVEWSGADLGRATGAAYDLVQGRKVEKLVDGRMVTEFEPLVKHLNQAVLNVAANTAVMKRLGDSFVWDRYKSPADCAPLVAWSGALWLLGKPAEAPRKSAYEDNDLMVV